MFQLNYKHLFSGLILGISLLFFVSTTQAGGWAVVTLDELPAQVVAKQPFTVGFMVRQHGLRPTEGLTPQIRAVHADTRESFDVVAKPEGKAGHYIATLTFPQPGNWEWSIEAFPFPQTMPVLTVLATTPAAVEPVTQSPQWPLLVGVIGLIGAAGTSLLWWRRRTWWMTVPVVTTIIVSGVGFASAGSYTGQVEVEEAPSAQVELGRNLFIAKGCIVCHHHTDLAEIRRGFVEFRVGPDLPSLITMSAEPAFIHTWLKDPTAVKPDTKMPNLELKQTEIEALTAFLLNSKPAGGSAETTSADTENLMPSSQ